MFFLSNPNGIEGTFGAPPALSLARRENSQRRLENAHDNCVQQQPQNPARRSQSLPRLNYPKCSISSSVRIRTFLVKC